MFSLATIRMAPFVPLSTSYNDSWSRSGLGVHKGFGEGPMANDMTGVHNPSGSAASLVEALQIVVQLSPKVFLHAKSRVQAYGCVLCCKRWHICLDRVSGHWVRSMQA